MNKLLPSDINKILQEIKPHIRLIEETFVGSRTVAAFIDCEYGIFYAKPCKVIYRDKNHPDRSRRNIVKKNTKWTLDFLKEYLKEHMPFITVVSKDVKGRRHKCTFLDEQYGEFISTPDLVIRGYTHPKRGVDSRKSKMRDRYGVEYYSQHKDWKSKVTETYNRRYGVNHNMQDTECALKVAKSSNKSCIKYHWKDSKELVCVGSYEAKVVDYLNKQHIEFDWQPCSVLLPNGSSYRPDLYLTTDGKYIEIKGYLREDAKVKWLLFIAMYPNSEMWGKKELEEMGILARDTI